MLTLYIFAAIVLARVEIASAAPQFADAHLEQSVRVELGQLRGELRAEDCAHMLFLTAERAQIEQLEGIEQLLDLRLLQLAYNEIVDLQPLESLVALRELHLSNNPLQSIAPLRRLNQLAYLD